jgi:hypothetical protein
VTLPNGYAFRVTHLPNTLRVPYPLATDAHARSKPEIWLFGCSFTHGWSLNDEETYPWVLQERLPMYEVVNYGAWRCGTSWARSFSRMPGSTTQVTFATPSQRSNTGNSP